MPTININWLYATNIFQMLFLSFLHSCKTNRHSQLICTENHLACFYMIWKKRKMKLNWEHYEELRNVPINFIINNYDHVINFASRLAFIKRIWCSWQRFPWPRNRVNSPKIITVFVMYFFGVPGIIMRSCIWKCLQAIELRMFLRPVTICKAVRAIIVFRSKFPTVHKIFMKCDYSFCERSYCIDRCDYRPSENSKSGSTYPKCNLYNSSWSWNPIIRNLFLFFSRCSCIRFSISV